MPAKSSVPSIAEDSLHVIRNRMRRGELALFTGAGFSRDATAVDGQSVPGKDELKEILWPIAFPGETIDATSSLGEIFECAIQQSSTAVKRELEKCLTIRSSDLPEIYAKWLALPWFRIYTLNIDDLEEATQRQFDIPLRLISTSINDPVPNPDAAILYVHLNGKVGEIPKVTFSPFQYAERLPGRDPWYAILAADLSRKSFIFVGSSLDEPPMWDHVALRGERPGREIRPRSFLVTPELPVARRRLLAEFNIDWIPMDQESFLYEVLLPLEAEATSGRAVLRQQREHLARSPVRSITEVRSERRDIALAQYLLGREPSWQDISDGYSIEREFETDLIDPERVVEPAVTLFTGTAGTGKSTTLMRMCLALDAQGHQVAWLDLSSNHTIAQLKAAIIGADPEYIAIDDLDLLGAQSASFVTELLDRKPELKVLAACRSARAERFDVIRALTRLDCKNVVVPPLADSDISLLLDALEKAGVLGQLQGLSMAERRSVFSRKAGRQLIVAMIEATSGRDFDDKIEGETAELPTDMAFLYAIVALATRARTWLSRETILFAAGDTSATQLEKLEALIRQHLVVEPIVDQLELRHRVIAERVVACFRRQGQLGEAVEGLLLAMAMRTVGMHGTQNRERRLLVKLLNHRFMIEEVCDAGQIRAIYESLRSTLGDDFHYWLQRGSFEVQVGDLSLAENYLDQAKGLASTDYRVQTEWAYMSLKRAAEDAGAGIHGWRERAEAGFSELEDAISRRGTEDSYPYHVLGSQGLRYVRRAPLVQIEKQQILGRLLERVKQGVALHGGDELESLREAIERDYLLTAVPPAEVADP